MASLYINVLPLAIHLAFSIVVYSKFWFLPFSRVHLWCHDNILHVLFIQLTLPFNFQAEPLIENLALHKLVDDRVAKTYDTYELYLMARTAYLCVQISPENRPSMGEVISLS